MTPASLRHAMAWDLDAILTLERAAELAPHWSASAYADILDQAEPRRCLIVAETDGGLAGFAVGLMHPFPQGSSGLAELESVVVATDARRAGIGGALCKAVFEWCRIQGAMEIVLEVRAASTGAIALYSGLDFERTGRRRRYYSDPEDDALAMRLRLDRPDLPDESK